MAEIKGRLLNPTQACVPPTRAMDVPDKLPSGFLMWESISISPFWQVCHLHDDETVVSTPLHLAIRQFPSSAIIAVKQFAHADSFGG